MPDVFRLPRRMEFSGIDFVTPLDRMPPGALPYAFNVRVLEEGILEGRAGYTQFLLSPGAPNSVRRLNDTAKIYRPEGFLYIGGAATNLCAGTPGPSPPGHWAIKDTGYSGDPLSLIPFRPEQSPGAWMYVYDQSKNTKMRGDGLVLPIGIAPPTQAPVIEYATPAQVLITDGQDATPWVADGGVTVMPTADRTGGSLPTIAGVAYFSGTTGWALITPNFAAEWPGERMGMILASGAANQETVYVREIHPAIPATTIAAIQYDSGSTGPCSIVLTSNVQPMERNTQIVISGEVIRVLEVVPKPDATGYSIRCSTTATHAAGDQVLGQISWLVYTTLHHVGGESVTTKFVEITQPAPVAPATSVTGGAHLQANVNASLANNRAIDPANDYLHISVWLEFPQNVMSFQILVNMDVPFNPSFSTPGNSYIWTIPATDLPGGASTWGEIVLPISSADRTGTELDLTLAQISGMAVQVEGSGATHWGFDWWYLFGTYGPVIQPNAPTGYQYGSRNRDVTTGAKSVLSPLTRYALFPLREGVVVTPQTSMSQAVNTLDIYRFGGTLSQPFFVGSVLNTPPPAAPSSFIDTLDDATVLKINQPADPTQLQPWPTLDTPWTGECTVIGTTVIWTKGTQFNTSLVSGSIILINGVAFQTYGQPRSATVLELTQSAGYLASANFSIASPTLAGQPLPFAFGALEGPFAPVIFALGDPKNGGTLYFSNFSDADSASDVNSLEVVPPGNDLVSGAVWHGMAFCGNRDEIFVVRYSYLTTLGVSPAASGVPTYQWNKISAPSGIWSRWACAACPLGVAYLGRDGIYIATETQAVNITDEKLYGLFPHDGVAAKPLLAGPNVVGGSNTIWPVDMTKVNYLRLSYCDESLRFSYVDTQLNLNTLIFQIPRKRWLINNFTGGIGASYLTEGNPSGPLDQEILMLQFGNYAIAKEGGNSDNGADINSVILTPSDDGGDERAQKLYVDLMVQADGEGVVNLALSYDNATSFSQASSFTVTGGTGAVGQFLTNIDSLADLSLHRNVGVKLDWTGGPDGPRIYAVEATGFMQPYLTSRFVTQFIPFSFPGFKQIRRFYPALISTGDVLFTIQTQDGRTFGPYLIPSTNGQYRNVPMIADHGCKDLSFALQLDGGSPFAFFPADFVAEVKEWTEQSYIRLAVFKA
jgi:hypothetical protein